MLDVEDVSMSLACSFVMSPPACALQYLHGRNISHLDLKPQNILLSGSVLKLSGKYTPRKHTHTNTHSRSGGVRWTGLGVPKAEWGTPKEYVYIYTHAHTHPHHTTPQTPLTHTPPHPSVSYPGTEADSIMLAYCLAT